jgi:transcriptional regulator with XRE-family HTH domain
MNALRTWRREQGLTIGEMAGKLGVSVGSLSRIERDDQWPDREFFERMTEATSGAVTANDFVPGAVAQSNSFDAVNDEVAA